MTRVTEGRGKKKHRMAWDPCCPKDRTEVITRGGVMWGVVMHMGTMPSLLAQRASAAPALGAAPPHTFWTCTKE